MCSDYLNLVVVDEKELKQKLDLLNKEASKYSLRLMLETSDLTCNLFGKLQNKLVSKEARCGLKKKG